MSRTHWPQSWGADFEALLAFHSVRAVDNAGTVILLDSNNVAFAVVPVTIELGVLKVALPLLRESYDMGVQIGRDTLSAEFRAQLGIKPD